ncbi:GGDEF domain-containing protein [Clostridium sp. AWRP]|uniref:GGDEF domain-containing protein n=1 Tax=Clostridium sp. AWRP TaxID=2212991 RepID=UPI000FDACEFB|nr:GGDEF domain-containing protein [Clostridium sp. AWRP]AZV58325.1 EAL domain-containing protein [Clostridium sp. AWRP]
MSIDNELNKILAEESISTVFQPIISLKNGFVIGYEALSRGPKGSPLYFPDKLFSAAEKYNKTWELEFLCRVKAIEKANSIDKNKLLFINVDPKIFRDERFKSGFTKEFLKKHNMSPDSIIFEITEKTAIEDYKSFKSALENYINQGYKIAIDDTGAGYSGLKTLMETKPNYIKIDISFVKDIDKDSFKQELMKTFVNLARATHMRLIAEGIETKEELLALIKIGVCAGQGYFLQRPAGTFLDIPQNVREKIIDYNKIPDNKAKFEKSYIGDIARENKTFSVSTKSENIKKFFEQSGVTGVCIVNENFPTGLIMKHNLDSMLATKYGISVFLKRPISLIMDCSPLIVDYYDSISEVSKTAMARENSKIYDYVIVTKNSKYCGIVTVKCLLEYTVEFEKNYAKNLNPLTGLPGNAIINKTLKDMIGYKNNFLLLYADLNNFKVYNDTYGFENGDKVLKFTSIFLENKIKKSFPYNSFIGHLGGDDFVCIIEDTAAKCYKLCEEMIREFDLKILNFFNEKDKENNYIESFDRKGNKDIFPLTSIAFGGMYGNINRFKDVDEIGEYMSTLKKQAKGNRDRSSYIIDEVY